MSSYLEKNTIYSNSSANNNHIQINVSGWKTIQTITSGVTLLSDGKLGCLQIGKDTVTLSGTTTICDIPSEYAPAYLYVAPVAAGSNVAHLTINDGKLKLVSTGSTGTTGLWNTLVYRLNSPKY